MARVMVILAFILCLSTAIPILNILSPFSSSYQSPVSNGLTAPQVIKAAGCGSLGNGGGYNCSGGIATLGGSNNGIFGGATTSVLVFGYFMAGITFMLQIASGVVVPGQYVLAWMGGPGNIAALAFAGMIQALVWFTYAELIVYIVTGRWIFGSQG